MIVLPDCAIKPVSECKTGTLVRLVGHSGKGEFALVAGLSNGNDLALILFRVDGPEYLVENNPGKHKVISYNSDWILEVDQHGPFESPIERMYEAPGCIILEDTRWLMNTLKANPQFSPSWKQYDLSTSQLVENSQKYTGIAIFGKWSLFLGSRDTPKDERIKIVDFEWTPATEQKS
jgi:hypothetical protein